MSDRMPRASGYFRTGYGQDIALIKTRLEGVSLAAFVVQEADARGGRGGGGGGRGGGGWGGGGGMKSGGGSGLKSGGGGMKGGGRAYSGRSYGGGDGWKGRSGGNNFKGRSSGRYAGKGWDGGDFKRGGSSKRWDGDKRRHASRDHDGRKFQRHRVWRNGAWVWVYGPDIYAYGDDCGWLWQRAQATGSPYWWSRYEACVGYY